MFKGLEKSIPELSIVVAIDSDTIQRTLDLSILRGCLESLVAQDQPPAFEIIVPYIVGAADFSQLLTDFPEVNFLQLQVLRSYKNGGVGREHHDELRACGMRAARAEIIALTEDYARPDSHWCREIILAHDKPFAGIGGAIENGMDRPLNWAVYFCDFGRYQNPLLAGESRYASDVNVSYKRSALSAIQGTWWDSYNEIQVNSELMKQGYKIALDPKIIVYQNRTGLGLRDALKERYVWGRSYSTSRIKVVGKPLRLIYLVTSPLLPFVLFTRVTARALSNPDNLNSYFRASILIGLLLVWWAVGEATGYLTGHT